MKSSFPVKLALGVVAVLAAAGCARQETLFKSGASPATRCG